MSKESFQPSDIATLKCVRTSELGAFLDAGTGKTSDDILLHKAQQSKPIAVGDEVTVFLYKDPKGRLAASMRLPQMKEGQVARVKVLSRTKDGAFVDVGAERGIFMPYAGMYGRVQEGDRVWVKLYRDKSGRLAVTMEVEQELNKAARPADGINIGDFITGTVYQLKEEGTFLFTPERYIAFLHPSEKTEDLRIGQDVSVRVIFVREDGRLNVSMRLQKEDALEKDADMIYQFLISRGGKMPYCDSTSPDIIRGKFNLSKAAFKRAMGRLMREGVIEQKDGWTNLTFPIEENKNENP